MIPVRASTAEWLGAFFQIGESSTVQNNTELPRTENWFVFLFSPNGRIPRKRYWLAFVLPSMLIYIAASIIDGMIAVGRGGDEPPMSALTGLAYLFFLWPSFAVVIKRLHDRGMTGWWSLIANGFVPVLILAVAAYWYYMAHMKPDGAGGSAASTAMILGVAALAGMLVWLFFWIQIAFVRGQSGANKYGDDPLPTPEAVRSDGVVTIVFGVLTAFFLFMLINAYWYYSVKTAEMRNQPTIEETSGEAAPVDEGMPPVEESAPADAAPPADEAPAEATPPQ